MHHVLSPGQPLKKLRCLKVSKMCHVGPDVDGLILFSWRKLGKINLIIRSKRVFSMIVSDTLNPMGDEPQGVRKDILIRA